MGLILDTNALSSIADDEPAAVRVFRRAASIELPAIAIGEYRFGLRESRFRSEYEAWLGGLIAAARFLPVDDETTLHYAAIRSELKAEGRPIPTNDLWMAALTRQHRVPLMTRDRHFDAIRGLERIGW
jgi:tRNA(fMet)-specific endonuclease VapC